MKRPNPCCVVGDFNTIRKKEERKGCIFDEKEAKLFNKFIKKADLIEGQMIGRKFTWYGHHSKRSKLDRMLFLVDWLHMFEKWSIKCLGRILSNHCAVISQYDDRVRVQNHLGS